LLIAVAPDRASALLELAHAGGFGAGRIVGRVSGGPAGITVEGGAG
jgi:hypothetical protein